MLNTGIKIKQIREAKGIQQGELAREVNISQSHLSKIESGLSRPDYDLVARITSFLKVPFEKFYLEHDQINLQPGNDQASDVSGENNMFKIQIDEYRKLLQQKDELIESYKTIIVQQNDMIDRRNAKIEELKRSDRNKM